MTVPGVKTLVYSPGARVWFATRNGMIDVSKDITNLQVTRKIDSVSSMSVALNNKNNKYTGLIDTNDRVVVFMRRLDEWVQVFSGLVDSVPVFSLYPTVTQITASCVLKRLKHTYYDPGLPETVNLLAQDINTHGSSSPDSNTMNLLGKFLVQVGGWDRNRIQITSLPNELISLVEKEMANVGSQDAYDSTREAVKELLGFSGYSAGAGEGAAGGVLTTGAQISGLSVEQSNNAWIIAGEAVSRGMGQKGALIGIITALAESEMRNLAGGDRDSVGMFQQRPSQGWGTPQELINPRISTKKFYDSFPQYAPNWKVEPEWVSAQRIQRSYANQAHNYGENYKARMDHGKQIVAQMFNADGSFGGQSSYEGMPVSAGGAWQHPLPGAPVTSKWGPRSGGFHRGLDFGAPYGTPIYAVESGVVLRAGAASGFGGYVCIKHPNGMATGYGHMKTSEIFVSVGQSVQKGQKIALVASEGQSTGPHLHLEVYANGVPFQNHIDPWGVLVNNGVNPNNGGPPAASNVIGPLGAEVVHASLGGVPTISESTPVEQMKSIFGKSKSEVESNLVSVNLQGTTIKVHKLAKEAFEKVNSDITEFEKTNTAVVGTPTGKYQINKAVSFSWGNLAGHDNQGLTPHSFGVAIDINPDTNKSGLVLTTDIPDGWIQAFKQNGFAWGGDYFPSTNPAHFMWLGGTNTQVDQVDETGAEIQRLADAVFNLAFQFPGQADPVSSMLTGDLAPVNDKPLLPAILQIAGAGMRSIMSSPTGDFVAFYPDYFGVFNPEVKFKIEDIEIKNLEITKSDDAFASHVYGIGNVVGNGTVSRTMTNAQYLLEGFGSVATVFNKELMRGLLGVDPDSDHEYSAEYLLQKYGVRPASFDFELIKSPAVEYFYTLYSFMKQWSKMYSSPVDITFMPEISPGFRVEFASQGVTVFVEGVTHTYSPTAGATTKLVVSSPTTKDGGVKGLVRTIN